MNFIHGKNISDVLLINNRIYLCGDLKMPQDLQWIHDENNEVGISSYKVFTADKPHVHLQAYEYNYILKGSSRLLIVDENKELEFEQGSLFVIPPNTKYASKHLSGTEILFFKSPGGNDKQLIEVSKALESWLSEW